MSTQKDGGSAFPLAVNSIAHGDFVHEGMSLRDYFAKDAEPFSEDTNPQWMADALGWPPPNVDEMTHNEWLLWSCRADAAYKYMQADAMLEAREKQT